MRSKETTLNKHKYRYYQENFKGLEITAQELEIKVKLQNLFYTTPNQVIGITA